MDRSSNALSPGASVAAVAVAFKLNDNLVHQWRRGRGAAGVAHAAYTAMVEPSHHFIELAVVPSEPAAAPKPSVAPVEVIRLEFKRGALGVVVKWPVSAAAGCAAWLREVLG